MNPPRPALVEAGVDGSPRVVNGQPVEYIRETWRVVDRWWTDDPVDRLYHEVVFESGESICVYRDGGSWFSQHA